MKYFFLCTVLLLFSFNNCHVLAQLKQNKKSITAKDLNKLELENIKTITFKKNKALDSVTTIKKDTIKIVCNPISTKIFIDTNNKNLLKKDSLPNKNLNNYQPIIVVKKLKDTIVLKQDSLNLNSISNNIDKNYKFADSIKNANKHMLDSLFATIPKNKPVVINKDDEIEIYVSGGGLYGGVNPKSYDVLMIFSNGFINRKFITKLQGVQVYEKTISKEELKKLAQYIISMGFFNYNKSYDCDRNDATCNTRLKSKPAPIPLTISVRIGERKMRTNVSFFAPNIEPNWVAYPASLVKIIDAIYAVAAK